MSVAARFTQPLRLGEAEDMSGLVVDAALDLSGAMLPNLDLRGATFRSSATFRGATFQGLAWFHGAVFEAGADFSHVTFGSDARFDDVQFRGPAVFSSAQFDGVPCFDRTRFLDAAHLDGMRCSGSLSLSCTEFNGFASLRDTVCEGGLWCDRATFRMEVERRGLLVHGRNWLSVQPRVVAASLPCGLG